ncbi:MAG: DNA polymerase III subunit alpha [Parcubacteria group bacterium]
MKYVPLHVHTEYSLLDGLTRVADLVQKAKDDGMPAVAITDHGVMYGAIEFYQACKKAGIKPIIGMEAYLVDDRKRKSNTEEKRKHLVLLAKNNQGYKNLLQLTTSGHLEGFYYKPRIDWDLLEQYHEGIIALSACLDGEIPRAILAGADEEKIGKLIEKYRGLFGDDFYLEVQHHPNIPRQKIINDRIFELGKKYNIPIVATNDSHYLNSEDAEAQDVLLCLQTKHTIGDTKRLSMLGEDFSLFTSEQMANNFRANPEVLSNTIAVAEKCNVEIQLGKTQLPKFDVPEGKTDFQYLRDMCYENIDRRFHFNYHSELTTENKKVVDRLEYELGVIEKMGFASYFLIVQDFINWSKNNGIVVGPGRGSASGSLVSYLVNITNLDPLAYDLLFERFLNPERISMPDVDTDFADERREEVIRYVEQKYGKGHVSQIITFGTMAARAAIRDVGRVLEMSYTFCDKVAKLIPMNMELGEALDRVAEVKDIYSTSGDAKRLIDLARKLEGVCRHASTHACGIVITPEPLVSQAPLQFARDQEEAIVTQYSLHPIEDLGLLKMDFLGLKNLTIIQRALEIIEKMNGLKIDVDNLPIGDAKTLKLFQDGKTTGVFQFESSGMKRYLKLLKPNNIEDLIAMVALYRPGPMEWIPEFIDRKHGRKAVEYIHPKLENSLKKTYGVAIYQEQLMQIARDLAGFSLGEADILRKAIGKKIAKLLAEQKQKFIDGCVANGIAKEIGEQVFAFIEPFASYGFNRSHAACYAYIAYQTGYLKSNFPAQFMAALMTSDMDDLERIAIEIDEAKQLGLEILPPSVNESFSTFTVVAESLNTEKPRIRFGLMAVRNIGENVAKAIIHERKTNGLFSSLEDFLSRLTTKELNKKSLEGLIKSGALEIFGARKQLLENMDKLILFVRELEQARNVKQDSLFSSGNVGAVTYGKIILNPAVASLPAEYLGWEKEFLGLYVSEHPFSSFQKRLSDVITPLSELTMGAEEKPSIRTAGVVSKIKKITTKKGDPMLFLTLEDALGGMEVLVFPRLYREQEANWVEGRVMILDGTLNDKDGELKILGNKVWWINDENFEEVMRKLQEPTTANGKSDGSGKPMRVGPQVVIHYPVGATKDTAERVKMFFMTIPGKHRVFLRVQEQLIKTNFMIAADDEARGKIEALLGVGAVE